MKMPCGYEGPRGGSPCKRLAEVRIAAGNPMHSPHASVWVCMDHRSWAEEWCFAQTRLMPTLVASVARSPLGPEEE